MFAPPLLLASNLRRRNKKLMLSWREKDEQTQSLCYHDRKDEGYAIMTRVYKICVARKSKKKPKSPDFPRGKLMSRTLPWQKKKVCLQLKIQLFIYIIRCKGSSAGSCTPSAKKRKASKLNLYELFFWSYYCIKADQVPKVTEQQRQEPESSAAVTDLESSLRASSCRW